MTTRFALLLLSLMTLMPSAGRCDPGRVEPAKGLAAERAAFEAVRGRWKAGPTDVTAGWELGRAAFEAADASTNHHERAYFATNGIAACRQAAARDPGSAPARYYLALNLGELASTRGLSALHLVRDMEKELLQALQLDPHWDHAGPDRTLGLLYRDAPGWPTSVGNNVKARQHLEAAARLDPAYPENRLALAEVHSHGRHKEALAEDMKALDALWPKAREALAGPQWSRAWADWEARRRALAKRAPQAAEAGPAPAR